MGRVKGRNKVMNQEIESVPNKKKKKKEIDRLKSKTL